MNNVNVVFVADSDQSARTGLVRLLRVAGYDIREFTSVEDLLVALRFDMPGCVVLEVRMLRLSDKELQAELSACSAHVPIIIVSADDDPESRRIALKMGATGYFRKPIDGTALLDAIEWALQSSDSLESNQNDDNTIVSQS